MDDRDDRLLFSDSSEASEVESDGPRIYSVRELNSAAKNVLGSNFSDVWVAGEVSDLVCPFELKMGKSWFVVAR